MRLLLTTILFFFGPMIVMFALRNGFLLLRLWLQQLRVQHEHEVIDVTPKDSTSRRFLIISVCFSLAIFSYAWTVMDDQSENHLANDQREYVPAYIDQDGRLVKSHFRELDEIQEPLK